MTIDEYCDEVRKLLSAYVKDASLRLATVLKLIPPQANEVMIDVHVDQDGEGFLGIRVGLNGPDLFALNRAIEEYAQLFDTRMTETGLTPPLPLMEPFAEEFSVQDVLTDLGAEWIASVWNQIDRNGFSLPVTVVSTEGYGSIVPLRVA